jgi:hypothetical protein
MRVRTLTPRRADVAAVRFVRTVVQSVRAAVARSGWHLYRPEIHYMRGPGPMSRRRHAVTIQKTERLGFQARERTPTSCEDGQR